MPCKAKESTTAGAPTDLRERNCIARLCIGFSCCKEYIQVLLSRGLQFLNYEGKMKQ